MYANFYEVQTQFLHFLKVSSEEDLSRKIVLEVGIIWWIFYIPDINLEKKAETDEDTVSFWL